VFTGVRAGAPISAIRVRVAGVTGTDPLSRERVRTVADAIHRATGLDVDVTLGGSPTTVVVALPAGTGGRPPLLLSEQWQREGVVTAILQALDRKSLLLFGLVLIVCAVFIGNATAASVRARRRELAVLSCLGWTRGQLLRMVLYETGSIGVSAGVAGVPLSLAAGHAFDTSVGLARAAAALPAALVVSLVAALWPAWRASAPPPLLTMHRAHERGVALPSGRSLCGMAAANLLRVPGRTALALVAVAVGTAGLTLLVAISLAFRGSVVGSVLGDAVSLRARGADYFAVGVVVLLAAFAVADAVYLNLRDRYAEIAMLHATGWTDGELWRLVLVEAGLTGLAGAGLGGAAGMSAAAVLAGSVPVRLLVVAAGAAAATATVTVLATLVPTRALLRIPVASLLTRD
jgi:predicted lysophospholipase L1 biosynthesis ABC-type transport system permease subunit